MLNSGMRKLGIQNSPFNMAISRSSLQRRDCRIPGTAGVCGAPQKPSRTIGIRTQTARAVTPPRCRSRPLGPTRPVRVESAPSPGGAVATARASTTVPRHPPRSPGHQSRNTRHCLPSAGASRNRSYPSVIPACDRTLKRNARRMTACCSRVCPQRWSAATAFSPCSSSAST